MFNKSSLILPKQNKPKQNQTNIFMLSNQCW